MAHDIKKPGLGGLPEELVIIAVHGVDVLVLD
jgi:hypothetical protein